MTDRIALLLAEKLGTHGKEWPEHLIVDRPDVIVGFHQIEIELSHIPFDKLVRRVAILSNGGNWDVDYTPEQKEHWRAYISNQLIK